MLLVRAAEPLRGKEEVQPSTREESKISVGCIQSKPSLETAKKTGCGNPR